MKKRQKNHCIRSKDDLIFDTIVHAILIVLTIFFLLPFLNVLSMSICDSEHVLTGDIYFWPKGLSLNGYKKIFTDSVTTKIPRAFLNSVFVCVVSGISAVAMTAVATYPLVFSNVPGKKMYSAMIMLTHWFSAGLVPTYVVMGKYGLMDSYMPLIMSGLITAYNVLVVKAYYNSIPMSLVEAGKIDGANDLWILFRVVLPMAKPVLAVIAMWTIVGRWNEYLQPAIYLQDKNKYTLQVVLRDFLANSKYLDDSAFMDLATMGLTEQVKYSTVIISMIPMLCIYPFFQRYFIKGLMIGAVKE